MQCAKLAYLGLARHPLCPCEPSIVFQWPHPLYRAGKVDGVIGFRWAKQDTDDTMTSAAPDFSFIRDRMTRTMYTEMYIAIEKADAWAEMREDPGEGGYMFSGAPVISKISAHLNDTVGHSGASFGITMRSMQRLARVGWDTWSAEIKEAQAAEANRQAAKDRQMAEACFAAAGLDPHEKCPHGIPGYACMPCSH